MKPRAQEHPAEFLFRCLEQVRPYPSDVHEVPGHVDGTAFFPVGRGLWIPDITRIPPLSPGGVMVLGNNFGAIGNFAAIQARDAEDVENDKRWCPLRRDLERHSICLERCFFTNAFMELIDGTRNLQNCRGLRDPGFRFRCSTFLQCQLEMIEPSLVLVLGRDAASMVAQLSPEASAMWGSAGTWRQIDANDGGFIREAKFLGLSAPIRIAVIVHPSMRNSNVGSRQYHGLSGAEAEEQILTDAFAGLKSDDL